MSESKESEWVLCKYDLQERITVPSVIRDYYKLNGTHVLAKFKRAEKVE